MVNKNTNYSSSDYANIYYHYPEKDNYYRIESETIGLPFIHISWMISNMNEKV